MTDLTLTHPGHPTAGRRFGYVVAAAVNLALVWIAGNLLGWGWPPFLSDAFDELLPVVTVSLLASVVVNLLWAVHDPPWLKHAGQIVLNLIGLVVAVRTWQVFPFDFSGDASFWEPLVRVVIVASVIGLAVSTAVELVRLVIDAGDRTAPSATRPAHPHRAAA